MRWMILLTVPLMLLGSEFSELLQGVEQNGLLRAKTYEARAKKELYEASQGKNLPTIDASLTAAKLNETPTLYLHIPGSPVLGVPAGKQTRIEGEVKLGYPLFSGFAIASLIQKSKLEAIKAKLQKRDAKRNLYLQASKLYAALYAAKKEMQALKKAYEALQLSYKKAEGFYAQGLIPKSEVANIEAKMYGVQAKLVSAQARARSLANMLEYLTGIQPSATTLPKIKEVAGQKLLRRADIAALQKALAIARTDIRAARSRFWPQVGIEASFKRFGDSIALDGDGYRNADESYVGVGVRYNLFNGFADTHTLQAAKAAYMAKKSFFTDYVRRARTELTNAKIELAALKSRLQWAKKRLEAAREYARLVRGRFANQLASADELSRAIAKEAEAKAALEAVRAQIFAKRCEVALKIGLEAFREAVR